MVGFTAHTAADMFPLFWGHDVVMEQMDKLPQSMSALIAVISVLLPFIGLLLSFYTKRRACVVLNFVMACFISLFNLAHMAELAHPDALFGQFIIMPIIAVVSILLSVELFYQQKSMQTTQNEPTEI